MGIVVLKATKDILLYYWIELNFEGEVIAEDFERYLKQSSVME